MTFIKTRLALELTVATALVFTAQAAPLALPDGSEQLGPPIGVTLATGTDVILAGVGLKDAQPGTMTFDVPAGVIVRQVLAYWEGHANTAGEQGPTDTVTIGGFAVTGGRIGGPTEWPTNPDRFTSTYRADITGLGLVLNGANAIEVSGLDFSLANNGLGLVIIVDDLGADTAIDLRDGNDTAFVNWNAPLDTTAPVTYAFAPSAADRQASLGWMVASVALGRPSIIEISIDGVLDHSINDVLGNLAGPEWDVLEYAFTLPAGATSVTVQLFSEDSGVGQYAGNLPASMTWIGSTFALETPNEPPGDEGCTPGYWKVSQHHDSWGPTGYAPNDNFDQVFGVSVFGKKTLLQVLSTGGGGEKALGRHAVAALLNAAHPDVEYGLTEAQVLIVVSDALNGGDDDVIEDLKNLLDDLNNAGCPLN